MFDLKADDGSVRRKRKLTDAVDAPEEPPAQRRLAKLDRPETTQLWYRLQDLYTRELDRQADNRREMAQDADFYDNIQWDPSDAQTLRDRGQIPLVYNVIAASVDWVTGTERRTRTDFKVLPRRKEHAKPAERKTQLLKYLSDVNRTPFHRSRAFADAVKVGVGWLEDGIQGDDEDEPLYSRYEKWRNMLWDSAATELDLTDARYIFRTKWVDVDVACALAPKRRAIIERAAADNHDYIAMDLLGDDAMDAQEVEMESSDGRSRASDMITGYRRQRVRVIEAWFRTPKKVARVARGDFKGEIYDEFSPAHREAMADGGTKDSNGMRMHVALFTSAGMIWFSESPYRHNRFPFTPIWGYQRDRDGMPYGMVRRIKDIQVDVNKRASKALYILSTSKTIIDEGAIPDDVTVEEFQDEVARPDAFIVKKKGYEVTLNADRDLAQWHLEMMSRSIAMIQQSSGVTDENLGRRTNASSGIAIQRRQDQGSLATALLFDNLLLSRQIQGEKQLANIEQFVSEEKAFRITNMRKAPDYIVVNDGLPENDITRSKADYVIDEEGWHATLRQAATEALLEVIGRMPPEVGMVLLDLAVENMDLPNREEIVRRIRQVTGQSDPDAEEPSPEEQARAQQANAAAQMQAAMAAAQLREAEAKATRLEAEAEKARAAVDQIKAQTVNAKVDAQTKALGVAQQAIAVPATTHVADFVLAEAGFTAQSDNPPPHDAPGLMQTPQPPTRTADAPQAQPF